MRPAPRCLLPLALLAAACQETSAPTLNPLTSFQVEVTGVYADPGTGRVPLDVTTRCARQHGGQAQVPAALRGTAGCRYVIPHGEVQFDVRATALDLSGQPYAGYGAAASFRVVPGDLSGAMSGRWAVADAGVVAATVRAVHQYGPVRVWVEDAPPQNLYANGGAIPDGLPPEPARRTYAAGASAEIFFDDQTLQSLQLPDGLDNKSSPFVGNFVQVGKNPESGETLTQSCPDDPARDGQPVLMVVTGLDPSGFYVTDVSACRVVEKTGARTPEPPEACLVGLDDGGTLPVDQAGPGATGACQISRGACTADGGCKRYLPGTYGHMFVYNYNFPDGLYEGDLLFTLSGSVQEFTSSTQMVFPAWSVAEHVRSLPPDQWTKWLSAAPPVPITLRTCNMDDKLLPFLTDQLCAQNKASMKMESLESALVKLRNVRFPDQFAACDLDGDGTVPMFCEQPDSRGVYFWGACIFDGTPEPDNARAERQCYQDCHVQAGAHAGHVCSEETTFKSFGQYVVELGPPGLASSGLDDSLPNRSQKIAVPGDPAQSVRIGGYAPGDQLAISCSADARFRQGDAAVSASAADPVLAVGSWRMLTLQAGESAVAFAGTGAAATCAVGRNVHSIINLVTKDAVPQLNPDCRTDDPDPGAAAQCTALRAATFDVVGHLRQVQPARPRWLVTPRYPEDLCCHPGPGLSCPTPIQPCP